MALTIQGLIENFKPHPEINDVIKSSEIKKTIALLEGEEYLIFCESEVGIIKALIANYVFSKVKEREYLVNIENLEQDILKYGFKHVD